ncbi:MAG: hypothetical protein WD800_04085, partial [Dehalococcoidia bacterium]
EWSCASVLEAYQKYDWRGDLSSTQRTLAPFRTAMRAALEGGDAHVFTEAGVSVLRWGGVLAHNGATLRALGADSTAVFQAAVGQLDPQTADLTRVDHVRLMNAGFTKIYSQLIDDFPIYDGRVGAALGYLVRLHLEERGAPKVPDLLKFPWGVAKGYVRGSARKNRNPSLGALTFPALRADVRLHTRANIMAAWLLGELSATGCFGQLPRTERVLALQSGLFMIGFEVPLSGGHESPPEAERERG